MSNQIYSASFSYSVSQFRSHTLALPLDLALSISIYDCNWAMAWEFMSRFSAAVHTNIYMNRTQPDRKRKIDREIDRESFIKILCKCVNMLKMLVKFVKRTRNTVEMENIELNVRASHLPNHRFPVNYQNYALKYAVLSNNFWRQSLFSLPSTKPTARLSRFIYIYISGCRRNSN